MASSKEKSMRTADEFEGTKKSRPATKLRLETQHHHHHFNKTTLERMRFRHVASLSGLPGFPSFKVSAHMISDSRTSVRELRFIWSILDGGRYVPGDSNGHIGVVLSLAFPCSVFKADADDMVTFGRPCCDFTVVGCDSENCFLRVAAFVIVCSRNGRHDMPVGPA